MADRFLLRRSDPVAVRRLPDPMRPIAGAGHIMIPEKQIIMA
jgi:hypothetical protein